MRKEVGIAIILGFALGLLIVGGIWWTGQKNEEAAISSDQEKAEIVDSTDSEASSEELSVSKEASIFVDISTPEEGTIVDQDEVLVVGRTLPEAVVVIIYPEGETIVLADEDGNFEGTALLVGGANEIKVTVYDYQGNNEEALLTVVYSTAKL
ncbi:MAG: transmembrane(s)proteins 7..26 [Microgenomates bacterium 39_6]|nr:MAG: transmembrane(s)proteins 7..26 [Microgenomates bacterium 39_6]